MNNALSATGIALPQINTVDRFAEGNAAAQQSQDNQITLAQKAMSNIGSIALASMGGKLDGQVDPKMFSQGLDLLQQHGMDVSKFRDHPEMAPIAAKAAMTTLQQLDNARSDADAEMAVKKFGLDVQEAQARIAALKAKTADGGYDSPEKFSLNPTYYKIKGEDGKDHVLFGTMGDRGTFKEVALPEGGEPAIPVQQMNTGTQFQPVTKFGDVPADAPVTAIDNEGKARDTAVGDIEGKNAGGAPAAIATADTMLQQIDNVLADPDLGQAVGIGGLLPPIPNTHQAGIVTAIEQLQGGAFLDAYNSLKGAGQISEVEGKKATQAIARLSRVQNLDDFKAALGELRDIVEGAKSRAEKAASGKTAATSSGAPDGNLPAPEIGAVEDGYRFKGGDPSDETSWEKVD